MKKMVLHAHTEEEETSPRAEKIKDNCKVEAVH
jgi:hypothetical protein